jgi:V-type H+-transporting ATPase 16kDa proteolipid subunit
MSGIIAVYGLVVSVLIAGGRKCLWRDARSVLFDSNLFPPLTRRCIVDPSKDYPLYSGFVHLGAGLACGCTGLAAGYAVGIVGDSVRTPAVTRFGFALTLLA